TLDETEAAYAGADRSQAAGCGCGPGNWDSDRGHLQEAWCFDQHVLPLAESVRWDEDGCREAAPRPREGEQPTQEGGGGANPGQADPEGGHRGKILSPARKRQAVQHVCRLLDVSERRACQVLDQPRSTQRYVGENRPKERRLVKRLRELSRRYPR